MCTCRSRVYEHGALVFHGIDLVPRVGVLAMAMPPFGTEGAMHLLRHVPILSPHHPLASNPHSEPTRFSPARSVRYTDFTYLAPIAPSSLPTLCAQGFSPHPLSGHLFACSCWSPPLPVIVSAIIPGASPFDWVCLEMHLHLSKDAEWVNSPTQSLKVIPFEMPLLWLVTSNGSQKELRPTCISADSTHRSGFWCRHQPSQSECPRVILVAESSVCRGLNPLRRHGHLELHLFDLVGWGRVGALDGVGLMV